MDQYSHLQFYKNSERGRGTITLGGAQILGLQDDGIDENEQSLLRIGSKTATEKHADILEYLKRLPPDARASFVDINRVLNIDLEGVDEDVMNVIRNNPIIDLDISAIDGTVTLQFRGKYDIRNKQQLLAMVDRVKSGILISDIKDCYAGIEDHCADLVVSGEVIEYKNNDKKTGVLYPRGKPFLTQLPGTAQVTPGQQKIITSTDLRGMLFRGDAIRISTASNSGSSSSNSGRSSSSSIGNNTTSSTASNTSNITTGTWYRVSSATGVGDDRWNKLSSSVQNDEEIQSTRVGFLEEFTESNLPLDADYEGPSQAQAQENQQQDPQQRYQGLNPLGVVAAGSGGQQQGEIVQKALLYKHGCTNDIRQYWNDSAIEMRKNISGEEALIEELLKHKLINRPEMSLQMQQQKHGSQYKRLSKLDEKKARKKTVRSSSSSSATASYHNAHLKGSELERIVNEAYESSLLNNSNS